MEKFNLYYFNKHVIISLRALHSSSISFEIVHDGWRKFPHSQQGLQFAREIGPRVLVAISGTARTRTDATNEMKGVLNF